MTAEPLAPDRSTAGVPATDAGFRPDIEGLRGIAVLLVVLFHAGAPVPGGFVGVDVFFVISGFLITGLLLREHRATGRVALAAFYARRVRRLLPAALVTIAISLPLAYVVLGPLDRPAAMLDGASAALSFSNIRFALADGDYFSAVTQPSPFLQFWSLAVEEQFYLLWPALLFGIARGGWLRVQLVLAVVLGASFGAAMAIVHGSTGWAFYSLPTRAWELAAGGLLAVAVTGLDRLPGWLVTPAGWLGAVALAVAAMAISGAVPYPSPIAALPVLAAVLLIAAGGRRLGPGLLLRLPPVRFLGRISYSLYLWHWPILVLPALAAGAAGELGPAVRAGLVGAAIVVAWLSWRMIEEPFRRRAATPAITPPAPDSPPVMRRPARPRRVLATGAVAIAVVALLANGLAIGGLRAIDSIAAAAVQPTPTPPATDAPPSQTPGSSGPTLDPGASPAEPTPEATPLPTETPPPLLGWADIPDIALVDPIPLPAGLRPSLADARTDTESLWRDQCGLQVDEIVPEDCVYGDPEGALTIALIGDSHAAQWFPAFEALAIRRHWRLEPYVKLSCPFIDVPVEHIALKREYTECSAWRDLVIARLQAHPVDLAIVAMSHRGIFPIAAADRGIRPEGEAIARAMVQIPGRLMIMIDTPRTSMDVPGCLASHPDDTRPCALERSPSLTDGFGEKERIAAEAAGAGILDIMPAVCPSMPCEMVRDGMVVYRDNHHLTATFSESLAPALEAALRPEVEALEAARRLESSPPG